jgi:outer membrane usher protein
MDRLVRTTRYRTGPARSRERFALARLARALVGLLLGLLLSTAARGARAEPSERAVLELEVNGTRHGDVIVLMSSNDVLVPLPALERAGIVKLRSAPVRYLGIDYVSLRRSDPHLAFRVNELDLVLEITAPPHALASATLDLSEPAPPGIWHADEPSAFLTYAPSVVDFSTFRAFAEAGFSSGPFRATSSASYQVAQQPVRLMSQLALADREQVRELTVGDSYVSTGPLGGSVLLGGFGVFRNFELDPYFVRIPRLGYRGSVMAPSTVDVYVNNVLVRRAAIAPGEFDLKGVAPASGAGNVRYVVRDPLSRQSDVVLDYYAASSALAPGLSEYSYAAGFQRQRYGIASFDYGQPLILGRYRIGVTPHLTSGFRAELGRSRLSGGSQITLSGSAGELELATAVSLDRSQRQLSRGAAGLVGYYYQTGRVSLRAVVKSTSPRYTTSSLDPIDDRDLFEQSTSASFSLSQKTSGAVQLGFADSRDAGEHVRMSCALNQQLSAEMFGQLIASRDRQTRGRDDYEVFATLSFILPADHTASLSSSASSRRVEATASLSRPIIGKTGLGYQGSATLSSRASHGSASMQQQNRYFRADASFFHDGRQLHTLLDGSGSVVWLNGAGTFLTRPIYDSFAVVEVPQTKGATVYLNNQAVGQTDEDGIVLVPDLQAYYGNRLRVDSSDLPNDVQVDDGEVLVAPVPHGGVHVSFASRRLRAVRGRIAPQGLELEKLRYGELSVRARGQVFTSPVGHGGEFELEGVPSGEWPAEVRSDDGYCTLSVIVPVAGKAIENLGRVPCRALESSP